ncbi:hypothetical protein [Marinagarivorans cellulosilyticus]|uniref:Uncharacterized protein n=1 Tax=Marinagarivorans cellulosilyticus TaxID=2721545 RepID=A0AAN1WHI8_9GAMM|nr:hypothetical protein [Marinagarivorans cellulosilyticus]BCD97717.1 hypothetical protein MARGE09_P1918 [Marinagarivorans cellulosilyticus]
MQILYKVFDHYKDHVVSGELLAAIINEGRAKLGFDEVVFLGLDKAQIAREASKLLQLSESEIKKAISTLPKTIDVGSGLSFIFHTEKTYKNINSKPTEKHYVFAPLLSESRLKLISQSGFCEGVMGAAEEHCPCTWVGLAEYLKYCKAERL